jgi:hypothetical protein
LVVNLDELNVAITHNYASASNLSSVFKFLDLKRDQVSGCRDRPDSIKPERLYEEFVGAMQKRHPELTQRALNDPNWACSAWNSCRESMEKAKSATCHGLGSIMTKAKAGDNGFAFSFV